MASTALVFGAGGSTGMGWQWGILSGLRDAGVDLLDADLLIGTSAGAVAAAMAATGTSLTESVDDVLSPDRKIDDRLVVSLAPFVEALTGLIKQGRSAEQIRGELGAMALAAENVRSEQTCRQLLLDYLPARWPARRLLVPALDVESGTLATFRGESGESLVDAVAASNAVPLVYEPVTIGGRRYFDPIIRSPTNADLAVGHDRVVVLAPIPEIRGIPGSGIADQIAPLLLADGKVAAIVPDEASLAAIGRDQQDLTRQPAAVLAGQAQAAAELAAVRAVWLS